MTVASENTILQYTGNGSTVDFTTPFFRENSEIKAVLRESNAETELALTTNYNLTGAGVAGGGTLTMLTAPTATQTLTIMLEVDKTQSTNLVDLQSLPADTLEGMSDKLTQSVKELKEAVSRCLKLSPTSLLPNAGSGLLLKTATTDRAGKYLKFKSDGLELEATPVEVSTGATLLDEDDMSSNSNTSGATQQSIKAYVDKLERENLIINPYMHHWQRNTSIPSVAALQYTADRWRYNKNGVMVHTIAQSSVTPGISNSASSYSLLATVTTPDTSIAADEYCRIQQLIEGYNIVNLNGKTCTLSFWVRSSKTGVFCVSFVNSGLDAGFIREYTINQADTWEEKHVSVTLNFASGTWDFTNGIGLRVHWVLASGSNFHGTAGTWLSGDYTATSNQVNACDDTHTFYLTDVRFRVGDASTQVRKRPYEEEIVRCQRFYQKSYIHSTPAGSATAIGAVGFRTSDVASATYTMEYFTSFNTAMRATPTITTFDDAGVTGRVILSTGSKAPNSVVAAQNGFWLTATAASATTDRLLKFQYVANSELA